MGEELCTHSDVSMNVSPTVWAMTVEARTAVKKGISNSWADRENRVFGFMEFSSERFTNERDLSKNGGPAKIACSPLTSGMRSATRSLDLTQTVGPRPGGLTALPASPGCGRLESGFLSAAPCPVPSPARYNGAAEIRFSEIAL